MPSAFPFRERERDISRRTSGPKVLVSPEACRVLCASSANLEQGARQSNSAWRKARFRSLRALPRRLRLAILCYRRSCCRCSSPRAFNFSLGQLPARVKPVSPSKAAILESCDFVLHIPDRPCRARVVHDRLRDCTVGLTGASNMLVQGRPVARPTRSRILRPTLCGARNSPFRKSLSIGLLGSAPA